MPLQLLESRPADGIIKLVLKFSWRQPVRSLFSQHNPGCLSAFISLSIVLKSETYRHECITEIVHFSSYLSYFFSSQSRGGGGGSLESSDVKLLIFFISKQPKYCSIQPEPAFTFALKKTVDATEATSCSSRDK